MSLRKIFMASDPLTILEDLMAELRWKKRLLACQGVIEPVAQLQVPKSPNLLMPYTVEVQLRWKKEVDGGAKRFGANMPRFTDVQVQLLSREALKQRMEAWFEQVLLRV